MKKILHIFLSLILVYATTANSYAAGSWSVTKAVSNGATTVINATKGGYKNVIAVAPVAGRVGVQLLKGANTAALLYAASKLVVGGVDYVLDPSNNTIKYTVPADNTLNVPAVWRIEPNSDYNFASSSAAGAEACRLSSYPNLSSMKYLTPTWSYAFCSSATLPVRESYGDDVFGVTSKPNPAYNPDGLPPQQKTIPIASVALQVIANAAKNSAATAAQRAAAQSVTAAAAVASVIAGDYDSQLQAGAVPIGSDSSTASGGAAAAAGQAAADARANLDAQATATGAAVDSFNDARDAAITAADEAQDLINSGADEAAIQVAEAASRAANTIRDVTAAAVEASIQAQAVAARDAAAASKSYAEAARAADVTAQRAAAQAATNSADATQAADEAQNRLRTLGSETTQAVRDVAEAAATSTAEAAARALKVLGTLTIGATNAEIAAGLAAVEAKEAAKEAEKAKEKAEEKVPPKPFEFPAFCTWAVPVCDAIDWIKKDPVAVAPELVPVDDAPATSDATEFDVNYVNFAGQCPVLPSFNIGVGSNVTPMTFDMTPLCEIAVAIRPAIIAMAYFIGLGIVASSIRGT